MKTKGGSGSRNAKGSKVKKGITLATSPISWAQQKTNRNIHSSTSTTSNRSLLDFPDEILIKIFEHVLPFPSEAARVKTQTLSKRVNALVLVAEQDRARHLVKGKYCEAALADPKRKEDEKGQLLYTYIPRLGVLDRAVQELRPDTGAPMLDFTRAGLFLIEMLGQTDFPFHDAWAPELSCMPDHAPLLIRMASIDVTRHIFQHRAKPAPREYCRVDGIDPNSDSVYIAVEKALVTRGPKVAVRSWDKILRPHEYRQERSRERNLKPREPLGQMFKVLDRFSTIAKVLEPASPWAGLPPGHAATDVSRIISQQIETAYPGLGERFGCQSVENRLKEMLGGRSAANMVEELRKALDKGMLAAGKTGEARSGWRGFLKEAIEAKY